MRRLTTCLLALALLGFIVGFAHCDPFGGVPWPSHVEWTRYDVPGDDWHLVRPAAPADSSAQPYVGIDLPAGTQIYVPRRVAGRDPDGESDARNRKAAR